jgi:hypothetical protein
MIRSGWITAGLLALLLAAGFALRYQGSDWANLHPDSDKMARWMKHTSTHLYINDQVYPGGFFFLFRPIQWLSLGLLRDPEHVELNGQILTARELDLHLIVLARRFNVWLGTLTCAFVFLLAWRVFRSAAAGLAAAAFLAFSRFHVEHCHYEETDIAKLFALTLALLAWTWLAERFTRRRFLLASLLSGVAAGVKFPLLILLPLVPAYTAAMPLDGAWSRRLARMGPLVLAGLLLFLAGMALMNPAMLLNARWFIGRFAADAAGTLAEKAGVIGAAAGAPWAGVAHQSLWLLRFLGAWGWPALAAAALGAWLWFRNPGALRRGLPVWIFTLLFATHLLLVAPWIRMQETFPFLILAACGVGALAVVVFEAPRPGVWAWGRRIAAGGLTVLALAWGIQQSAWVSSLFAWEDTRGMAEAWLKRRWPPGATLGLEMYTKTQPVAHLPVPGAVGLYKIEHHDLATSHLAACSFVLRNETMLGRGLVNPFTGRLYDVCQERLDRFHDGWELLRDWTPSPAKGPADFAFVDPRLGLYGRRPPPAAIEAAAVPLLRPWHILPERLTYFRQGHELGAAEAVPVHRWGVEVAVGGPEPVLGPVYAIVFTRGEAAHVKIRGFGNSHVVSLDAWDADAVRLDRSSVLPRLHGFERVRAQVVTGSRRLEVLPCLTLAFSADEALATMLTLGRRSHALDIMDEWGMNRAEVDDPARGQPCLGQTRLAATHHSLTRWLAVAARSASRVLASQPGTARVNGQAEVHYDAFARVTTTPAFEAMLALEPEPGVSGRYSGLLEAPVLLPPGVWRLCGEWRADVATTSSDLEPIPVRVETLAGVSLWEGAVLPGGTNNWSTAAADWTVDAVTPLRLRVASSAPLRLIGRNLAVRWTLRERLASVCRSL